MKVLVTGACGFIGSNFVHYLLRERPDWEVCALDVLTYAGNLENLEPVLDNSKLEFVKLNICDQTRISELFEEKRFDLVFHLAAESHVDRSILNAAEFVNTNVVGTQVLLSAALKFGVSRFVHISTDEVYGSLGDTGRFLETTPLDPTSPYAASKASSDLMVLACNKTHGLETVVTRCTNNYGPYQFPEKLIPLFVTNALEERELPLYGDGMNVRSWIYVDDHSSALLGVAEKGRSGEVYNVGGFEDAEVPNKEITHRILKILDRPETLIKHVEDRSAHDWRYAVDCSKLVNEIGWSPQESLESGLEKTVKWYCENKPWWERIKSGEYQSYYEKQYGSR